jgi:hypothetical protein
MFNELFYYAGSLAASFARGTDMPTLREARIANAAHKALLISRAIGTPRVRPAVVPSYAGWTVKALRAEATRRRIKGRSKAKTKRALIALLSSAGPATLPSSFGSTGSTRSARRNSA